MAFAWPLTDLQLDTPTAPFPTTQPTPTIIMTRNDTSEETTMADETTDGPDKPAHVKTAMASLPNNTKSAHNPSRGPAATQTNANMPPTNKSAHQAIPLPPPEANSHDKQPGHTRGTLEKLTISAADDKKHQPPSAYSPTASESDWADRSTPTTQPSSSRGPSQPPSRPGSRAPSMSAGKAGGKLVIPPPSKEKDGKKSTPPTPTVKAKKTSSVTSDGGGHKFNLKDLLGAGGKMHRRGSQRSVGSRSSRKSDSDSDGGKPSGKAKSTGGDSATSLSKKYGVCQKVAIGKGATSVVKLAHKWDRTEEKLYAIKEFRKRRKNESEKEYVKKLTAEFCISSTLHHPNVVETVDLIQDENHAWCEVMEFCPGGDLYAAIKKGGMSPSEVECCFKQILYGVQYLHSQGVAHRDIKPENLFFDTQGHVKIGDYGASTVYRLPWEATIHMSTGLCGSEPYIAPEQFLGKPYDARLVDIWACGIVYYCLHFQELPWRAAQPATDSLYSAYAAACANPNATVSACPPTINNLSPRACRPVIRKMLEPDPRHRATIEEVVAHAWVKGIEVCTEVAEPKHIHVSAKAMEAMYMNSNH